MRMSLKYPATESQNINSSMVSMSLVDESNQPISGCVIPEETEEKQSVTKSEGDDKVIVVNSSCNSLDKGTKQVVKL